MNYTPQQIAEVVTDLMTAYNVIRTDDNSQQLARIDNKLNLIVQLISNKAEGGL